MRPIALLLLVLSSCAHVAAPASRPVAAIAVPPGVTCDAECLREMLAGVEYEKGDEQAKTAEAVQRENEAKRMILVSGAAGMLVGVVLGFIAGSAGGKH